ncbi:TNT domain-containing protein [Deinococcus multiflagellatus]|nr:TNT domain-containing protein [Deinococcus multiflagellatus]MBZ9713929.1 TNT domain-containing protein [Deinococcus multiflagellatus]
MLNYGFSPEEMLSLLQLRGATPEKVEIILNACARNKVDISDFRNVWAFNKPGPNEFPDPGNFPWPPKQGAIGAVLEIEIAPNTIIDRYGGEHGRFVGYAGTVSTNGARNFQPATFSQRALPGAPDETQYHVYQVLKPFPVKAGEIAPWFGEPGGGRQALSTGKSIAELIADGYLREITKEVVKK